MYADHEMLFYDDVNSPFNPFDDFDLIELFLLG